MIKSEIIADSINYKGNRLTTYILEYPRFIHAEVMTHRVFSKNAASSRAIPIEKMIQQVIDNPAMPEFWGKNQSGMQSNEELNNDIESIKEYSVDGFVGNITQFEAAKKTWLAARDKIIQYVHTLNRIGLHKQITNRLLEPFFNIRIILSGTEFGNFFALRAHKDAQPELQKLAFLMLEQYNNSKPKNLKQGEWHIPFGDKIEEKRLLSLAEKLVIDTKAISYDKNFTSYDVAKQEIKIKIAIARCARVSYFNYEGKDDYEADIKLCNRLFSNNPKHLSPTEHVAMALDNSDWCGNFKGFKQYRKFFEDENLKDERVKKYD